MANVAPIDPDGADESPLEAIVSEQTDEQASFRTFEILTYPADYTLEVLVDKWRKGQVLIPSFQRRFVWSQVQASKLIESFLLGLPVPSIFLFTDPATSHLLVVDGQQRLKTIAYFFEGYFGDEEAGTRTVFRLVGLDDDSRYLGKTYADLERDDPQAFHRLNDSVLRAFVIKQLDPDDNTSIYHIFERLNTGGTFLNPQEIRNCIHHGPFNDSLQQLNVATDAWRRIFGRTRPDKRQRDVELILRFLALHHNSSNYEKPMKEFLNEFMDANRHADASTLKMFSEAFGTTALAVFDALGAHPFHIRAGLNAAVFDSVFVAFSRHLSTVPADIKARYDKLIKNDDYLALVGSSTTDKEVVSGRLSLADKVLFS